MRILRTVLSGLLILALAGVAGPRARAADGDAPRITKEEAKALLGAPNAVFIDARTDASWNTSDKKIKGAVRLERWDLESLTAGYGKDTKFIVYGT